LIAPRWTPIVVNSDKTHINTLMCGAKLAATKRRRRTQKCLFTHVGPNLTYFGGDNNSPIHCQIVVLYK